MKILLPLLAGMLMVGACRKVKCSDYAISMIFFRAVEPIPDTLIKYSVYEKGGNFKVAIDSSQIKTESISASAAYVLLFKASDLGKYYFNQYDWIFTLYPSGKRYVIKEITFHKTVIKDKYADEETKCGNDFTFKANDSLYRIPGTIVYNSPTGYVNIAY